MFEILSLVLWARRRHPLTRRRHLAGSWHVRVVVGLTFLGPIVTDSPEFMRMISYEVRFTLVSCFVTVA